MERDERDRAQRETTEELPQETRLQYATHHDTLSRRNRTDRCNAANRVSAIVSQDTFWQPSVTKMPPSGYRTLAQAVWMRSHASRSNASDVA